MGRRRHARQSDGRNARLLRVKAPRFGRALVIRGGALGDFLLTLPALQALRHVASSVDLLAYPQCGALAKEAGLADDVRSIEYGPLAGFFARGAVQDPGLSAYFSSFDLVISYLYDPDRVFEDGLSAAGVKRFIAGTHRPTGKGHAIDELAKPLADLDLVLAERAVEIRIPGVLPQSSLLALHPGSGSREKNWPSQRWRELAQLLLDHHPLLNLAVIGGEADNEALQGFHDLRHHERVTFWENLPLNSLARQLAGARGYLGHDTGVSHLAAVLGIPSLLLFGPTAPDCWAPPHRHVQVLVAPERDLSQLGTSTVISATKNLIPTPLA